MDTLADFIFGRTPQPASQRAESLADQLAEQVQASPSKSKQVEPSKSELTCLTCLTSEQVPSKLETTCLALKQFLSELQRDLDTAKQVPSKSQASPSKSKQVQASQSELRLHLDEPVEKKQAKGGRERADRLTSERRREIAMMGVRARLDKRSKSAHKIGFKLEEYTTEEIAAGLRNRYEMP